MTNSKKRCLDCRQYQSVASGIVCNIGFFCGNDCRIRYGINKTKQLVAKSKQVKQKQQKVTDKQKKKELMSRAQWYDKLQRLVNQLVKIRDAGKPCCTCGTTNPNIKYDAGHFITQKGYDPRRFELTNIHIQCSVKCNQRGSGMRAEYREFIKETYGHDHLDWLECETNHVSLKERFLHWSDIEKEIVRYRKLIREQGFKPAI